MSRKEPTIQFLSLMMKNFKSYGNAPTIVDLSKVGSTLIIGDDLDNTANGQGGNGVGKSSIIDALIYCLYDRALKPDVKVDELINNVNKKNMEVVVTFKVKGTFYRIRRFRKAGKSGRDNGVEFHEISEDGEEIKDLTESSAITNNSIERVLGMTHLFELL